MDREVNTIQVFAMIANVIVCGSASVVWAIDMTISRSVPAKVLSWDSSGGAWAVLAVITLLNVAALVSAALNLRRE